VSRPGFFHTRQKAKRKIVTRFNIRIQKSHKVSALRDKDETAYAVLSLVAAEVRWLKRGDFVS